MIPKKIHYCWFGTKEKDKLIKKCIKSWKKKLPDYEIIEWNQNNFDLTQNQFALQAYREKKYAFVTDYVRLWALYNFGGIYLDSDVEVVKSLDKFLEYPAFGGFSSTPQFGGCWEIPTACMGAEPKNEWIKYLLDYYNDKVFVNHDGSFNTTTNAKIMTDMCEGMYKKENVQQTMTIGGTELFPMEYFEPINPYNNINIFSDNSFCIHWHNVSWGGPQGIISRFLWLQRKNRMQQKVEKNNEQYIKKH